MFSRADGIDSSCAPLRYAAMHGRGLTLALSALIILLVAPATLRAQGPASEGAVRSAVTTPGETEIGELRLMVGRSALVNTGQPIARVSLTRPEVADAVVTGPQQILVHGKTAGTISMFVWDRAGGTKRYDVMVGRDLSDLSEQMKQLFPGDTITVTNNGKSLTLSGTVSSKFVIEKAAEVAAGYVESKDNIVNLLRQQEGIGTNQVLLRVRFAEVSRSALTELGVSLFTGPNGYKDYVARSATQQFAAPIFDDKGGSSTKLVFSDYLNLFLFNNKEGLGAVIKALQTKGLFESLAEPNLVAEDGKEASFLAGGEYPYPVVQGNGTNLAVTIVFKEYGIRLNFLPELRGGDLVHLKVRPEVSTLDFNNAVTYQGFRIPALNTRRAETQVELHDGQTFAIAGLLNNTVTSTMSKIPGIGDIPILGYLFRSKAAQKNNTELVVMITPQILRRGSMGAAAGLPNLVEPYLGPPSKTYPQPTPRLPGSQGLIESTDGTVPPPAGGQAQPVNGRPAAPAAAQPATQGTPTRPSSSPTRQTPPPAAQDTPARTVPSAPARLISPAAPQPAPLTTAATAPSSASAPAAAQPSAAAATPQAPPLTAKELRQRQEAAEKLAEEQRKRAEQQRKVDAKRAEEQKKIDAKLAREREAAAKKQAEEARKAEEKQMKERAKRDAAAAKEQGELRKKQEEAEKERLREIRECTERLAAAQAALQAAVSKKGGS